MVLELLLHEFDVLQAQLGADGVDIPHGVDLIGGEGVTLGCPLALPPLTPFSENIKKAYSRMDRSRSLK